MMSLLLVQGRMLLGLLLLLLLFVLFMFLVFDLVKVIDCTAVAAAGHAILANSWKGERDRNIQFCFEE